MTDKDGAFIYSKVIQLKRSVKHQVTATYNAANKQVLITNSSNAICYWKLMSVNGALIQQGNSANTLITVNTSGVARGTYIISCSTTGETVNTSMVIY